MCQIAGTQAAEYLRVRPFFCASTSQYGASCRTCAIELQQEVKLHKQVVPYRYHRDRLHERYQTYQRTASLMLLASKKLFLPADPSLRLRPRGLEVADEPEPSGGNGRDHSGEDSRRVRANSSSNKNLMWLAASRKLPCGRSQIRFQMTS